MSEASKSARAAMKAKAKKMANGEPHAKVDASSWSPPEMMETTKKTGCRPVGKQAYKRGGKVVSGEKAKHHVGKMGRHPTHGCRVGNKDNYEGGTRPTGGRIARAGGGATTLKDMPIPKVEGYKRGGKTSKGKTNINIIIGGGHRDQPSAPPPPPQMPIRPPGMMMPPPGMPPPGAGAPMPMPPPTPPMAGMGRKSGGRARSYKDMEYGAGSGLGREQKTEIAKG